jgi:hypothetical protein
MAQIPFGKNDWQSLSRHIARMKARNIYIAENPFAPEGTSVFSRPSLDTYISVGSGPIRGIWRQDGTFGGDWFVVSGTELYLVDDVDGDAVLLGNVPGTGYCDFAGNEDKVVIVRDLFAYAYDGVSLSVIAMPDDLPVQTVAQIDGSFLIGIADSYRFYWMLPGESAPDPLNFASAERFPDPIISIKILGDEIWFIGSDSDEVWQQTGDLDAPYARIAGRAYTDGTLNRDTVASSDYNGYPCLLWVNQYKEVVLAQGQPNKVSTEAVEEDLRTATNLRGWAFRRNRADFYVLTFDQGTWVFNMSTPSWNKWDSFGYPYFRGHLGIQDGIIAYAADSDSANIYKLGQNAEDFGTDPIISQASGFVPWTGKQQPCFSVNVRADVGWAPSYDSPDQWIALKWSDDYGFTWSEPMHLSMGEKGQYDTDISFRSLGLIKRPGRLFELSYSGLQNFRIDYATMNEV